MEQKLEGKMEDCEHLVKLRIGMILIAKYSGWELIDEETGICLDKNCGFLSSKGSLFTVFQSSVNKCQTKTLILKTLVTSGHQSVLNSINIFTFNKAIDGRTTYVWNAKHRIKWTIYNK